MKKYLITFITLISTITSFAITSDELVTEFLNTSKIKTPSDYMTAISIIDRYKDDASFKALMLNYCKKDYPAYFAKLANKTYAELEKENKDAYISNSILGVFAGHWLAKYAMKELNNIPEESALCLLSTRCLKELEIKNPNIYNELKANDFKVKNIKLPNYVIFNLAVYKSDYSYLSTCNISDFNGREDILYKAFKTLDIDKAILRLEEIQEYYIDNNKTVPERFTAYYQYLLKKRLAKNTK